METKNIGSGDLRSTNCQASDSYRRRKWQVSAWPRLTPQPDYFAGDFIMDRRFAMMALVVATLLGTSTTLIAQYASAATTSTRGNGSATELSGIDAAEID